MKNEAKTKAGRTDWEALDRLSDQEVEDRAASDSDSPPFTAEDFSTLWLAAQANGDWWRPLGQSAAGTFPAHLQTSGGRHKQVNSVTRVAVPGSGTSRVVM